MNPFCRGGSSTTTKRYFHALTVQLVLVAQVFGTLTSVQNGWCWTIIDWLNKVIKYVNTQLDIICE